MKYTFGLILLFFIVCIGEAQMPVTRPHHNLINASDQVAGTSIAADQQAKSWEAQKNGNLYNSKAWFNYYVWTARDKSLSDAERKKVLATIISESHEYIAGKGDYYLMIFLHSGKKDSTAVYKALETAADKSIVYPYLIQYAIISGHDAEMAKWCRALDNTKCLSPWLYQYHYNALMSADTNAVIYASGLHDLVPMAVLQQVYHIRKDTRLKYYDGHIPARQQAYLCVSLGKEVLAEYPQAVCTGLLVKVHPQSSFDELKDHIEKSFDWHLLNSSQEWPQDVAQLYSNYLPGFIMLYRYYNAQNNSRANNLKLLIQKIAARAGKQNIMHKIQ